MANYKCQDYTICYEDNGRRKVGIIQNFLKISAKYYCSLEVLEKSAELIDNATENANLIAILDRFFLICHKSKKYELIPIENIREKCVLIDNDSECFISVYFEEFKS